MTDLSNPTFTPAHKVVLDCMGFVVAERARHDNHRMMLDALAEALPHAAATGQRVLDRVILAAVEVVRADRALLASDPGAALAWMAAMLSASSTMEEFFIWRGSRAIDALCASLAPGGGSV